MNHRHTTTNALGQDPEARGALPKKSRHETSPQRRAQTILLGIGNDRIRAEVESVLARLGTQVESVGDGYHVVEKIADAILDADSENRPCLIIVDSLLNGCTGLSLVAGLRQLGWDTPVILLTPQDDESLRRQAWEHGATGVFMAPFDARELGVFSELILDIGLRTALPDPRRPRNRRANPLLERHEREEQVSANG